MKVKTTLLVCCSLMLAASVFGVPPQATYFPKGISLTIDRHPGWSGGDEEGDALNIRCTFRNETKKPLSFLLADHSDYSGTLPYPVMMSARVTDAGGKVLTHTTSFGDWWSSYVLTSDSYREMPGDRVTLNPGEKVVRVVPLASVLMSLENRRGRLEAGDYTVELKLGDIVSNSMRLKVAAKE